MVDIAKVRREDIRWQAMLTLNNARPIGAYEELVLSVVRAIYPDATAMELRKELDYLAERKLIILERNRLVWFAKINRYGIDIVEYVVPCDPGIARPRKW